MTRFAPLLAIAAVLALAAAANAQYYTTYYAPAPTTVYYAPAPVATYYAPAPVTTYYAPAPVYVAPRAYYARPVVVAPLRPWRYRYW